MICGEEGLTGVQRTQASNDVYCVKYPGCLVICIPVLFFLEVCIPGAKPQHFHRWHTVRMSEAAVCPMPYYTLPNARGSSTEAMYSNTRPG